MLPSIVLRDAIEAHMNEPISSNSEIIYYAARLAGEFSSAVAALESVGYSSEEAAVHVENAEIERSESIVAEIGDGRGVAVVQLPTGCVQLWQAILSEASPERQAAEAVADELEAALVENNHPPSTWAIFEWRRPTSRTRQ